MRKSAIILSGAWLAAALTAAASSPDDNPYAISHYIVERKVVDPTELYDSTALQLRQAMEAAVPALNAGGIYSPLAAYAGGNLPAGNAALRSAAEQIVAFMEAEGHPKASKARKDFEKGKFNKDCGQALYEYLRLVDARANKVRNGMIDLGTALRNLEWDVHNSSADKLAATDGIRVITEYDTVPNPLFNSRERITVANSDGRDKAAQMGLWGWALDEDIVAHEQKYPKPLKYHYFKGHPDMVVRDNENYSRRFIFDRNGRLVRVLYMTTDEVDTKARHALPFFMRLAWEKNAYNIQSAPAAARHSIRVTAGLEEMTAAEKAQDAKRDKAMSDAFKEGILSGVKYDNKWAAEAARRRATREALSTPGGMKFNQQAANWESQIELDYGDALSRPYKVERIDDVTFKALYLNADDQIAYEAVYKFKTRPMGKYDDKFECDRYLVSIKEVAKPKDALETYPEKMVRVASLPEAARGGYSVPANPLVDFAASTVDKTAVYGAGANALSRYVSDNLVWPSEHNERVSAAAEVVIDRDGTPVWVTSYFDETRDPDFDDEIKRLIANMGKWTPAYSGGKPVRSRVVLLFTFMKGASSVDVLTESQRQQAQSRYKVSFKDSRLKSAGPAQISEPMAFDGLINAADLADGMDEETVYDMVEQSPIFPGGDSAIFQYVSDNLVLPAGTEFRGLVIAEFVIKSNGAVGQVRMKRSGGEMIDDAVISFVKSMPRFQPGKIGGRAVSSWFTLPISIK